MKRFIRTITGRKNQSFFFLVKLNFITVRIKDNKNIKLLIQMSETKKKIKYLKCIDYLIVIPTITYLKKRSKQ